MSLTNSSAAGTGDITIADEGSSPSIVYGGDVNIDNNIVLETGSRLKILAGSATLSGVITDSGAGKGISKDGAGTLALTNANSYSGMTTVNEGILLANNSSGSATGTGAVVVNSVGTLGGYGFIDGPVTINLGGTIAAGMSPGDLTIDYDLMLAGDSLFDIGGILSGEYDRILGIDSLFYGGTLTVNTGDDYGAFSLDLFDFALQSGTFTSIMDIGGNYTSDDLSFDYSTGVLSANTTAVPEPSSVLLLGLELLIVVFTIVIRKRKQQVAQ